LESTVRRKSSGQTSLPFWLRARRAALSQRTTGSAAHVYGSTSARAFQMVDRQVVHRRLMEHGRRHVSELR